MPKNITTKSNISSDLLGRVRRYMALDDEVLPTLMFRSWSVITGATTIILLPTWLTAEEQGYFYTFSSLLALQVFFELGLGQVIIQLVSHEYALLKVFGKDSAENTTDSALNRITSIVSMTKSWYRVAALLFAVTVSIAGLVFFSSKGNLSPSLWIGPWLILSAVTALNLYLTALVTILEGCGQIAIIARMRLAQSIVGYILMWLAFIIGGGLWSIIVVPLVASVYTSIWLRSHGTRVLSRISLTSSNSFETGIRWRTEIFPLQWRIALSWVSGYLIFQLFTPLTFSEYGPVEAGKIGITMAVFNALLGVAMGWVSAKNPEIAGYIALGERKKLNTLFVRAISRSIGFVVLAIIGVTMLLVSGTLLDFTFVDRFTSLDVFACIAMVTIGNSFVFAVATYTRAHKEEPMLKVSIITGILIATFAIWGIRHGVFVMMFTYALIVSFIVIPWTLYIFLPYYRKEI